MNRCSTQLPVYLDSLKIFTLAILFAREEFPPRPGDWTMAVKDMIWKKKKRKTIEHSFFCN